MSTQATLEAVADPSGGRRRPPFIHHASFLSPDAGSLYAPGGAPAADRQRPGEPMPDEVTRDCARRMHYAAYRQGLASGADEAGDWERAYLELRNRIVEGNRKLVYRAVRQRMAFCPMADDLASECHLVLIRAAAAYNPWMGIRFSTYAFTCLRRALGRLGRRMATDRLLKASPLDNVADSSQEAPAVDEGREPGHRLEEYLQDDHPLLTPREKDILLRRFNPAGAGKPPTLESIGVDFGVSKERVRQMQVRALGKLRRALLAPSVANRPSFDIR